MNRRETVLNRMRVVLGCIFVLVVACDANTAPTTPPVAVPVQPQTSASVPQPPTNPAPQTIAAPQPTVPEPEAKPEPRPRPAWVMRYGNDPKQRFPTVRKGGRSYSDADRKQQNERKIAFWQAYQAGEQAVLHVDYISGAHGSKAYWRLVTEGGKARLVILMRQSTISKNAPFGGNPLVWRLMDELPLTELRFGRLRWDDQERAHFKARKTFDANGPALGFQFEPTFGDQNSHFPPILGSIKSK